MYKVVKVKHVATLPLLKFLQAIPYSEAILDTVKWTFVARNSHECSLSVITCIQQFTEKQHTLTALKVVVLLQINSNYMSAICTVQEYNFASNHTNPQTLLGNTQLPIVESNL